MKNRLFVHIVDDYGEKTFTVSSYKDGIYNFYQKDYEGRKLRYNRNEERIEVYNAEKGYWDVYIQFLYNVQITTLQY